MDRHNIELCNIVLFTELNFKDDIGIYYNSDKKYASKIYRDNVDPALLTLDRGLLP